jgi:mRNA-degrading endonuclease toxin of MazEF toxin-antitoxin module
MICVLCNAGHELDHMPLPDSCAANFDNIQTVHKANIGAPITHLSASKMKAAAGAIAFALGIIDS